MEYLPWIEKYRPTSINEIISHDKNIITIKKLLENESLPHLLFHGTPGTGKTSTIMALAKYIYGKNLKLMVLKLDASDDRGINSVREEIKGFVTKENMFHQGVKLIILDEVDAMTFDAQFALRRIMEIYSETVRFCLICNYENKIIPAIRSRCACFRFGNIDIKHIKDKLLFISRNENINCSEEIINIISYLSKGDLRKGINLFQSIAMNGSILTKKLCYEITGLLTKEDLIILIDYMFDDNNDFNNCLDYMNNIIITNSISLQSLLCEINNIIIEYYIDRPYIIKFISYLSDFENMISKSTHIDIYITGLVSLFKIVKIN